MDVSRVYRTGTHAKMCALRNAARGTPHAAVYGEYSRVNVGTKHATHTTDARQLVEMFQNMPSPVVNKLRVACSAQGIVASERQALAMSLFDDSVPQQSATMYVDTLHTIDTIWETASVGACRRDICPTTGRRKRHFTNTAFLKWTGIHPEEWFTRIQNRELELFLTEYELLEWVMDEIACGHEGVTTRVRRHRHRPGICLFVRTTTTRVFDAFGRLFRLEHVCAPLSVEDLDEVLKTDPDMVQITYMGSGSSYADAGGGRRAWCWRDLC